MTASEMCHNLKMDFDIIWRCKPRNSYVECRYCTKENLCEWVSHLFLTHDKCKRENFYLTITQQRELQKANNSSECFYWNSEI